MSDSGRDTNLIPDAVQENWEAVRLERGWTWTQLAEQFDRDRDRQLAAWARGRARVEDGQGAGEAPRKRRGRTASTAAAAAPGQPSTDVEPAEHEPAQVPALTEPAPDVAGEQTSAA